MKKIVVFFIFFTSILNAQKIHSDSIQEKTSNKKIKLKELIIPSVLIGYGVIGIESDGLIALNSNIKEEINENIDEKFTIDDFSQYVPSVSVYSLNILGIKGKNDFKDRSIIFGTSYLIMSATVLSLKSITKVERPDGSSNNSFPSGHTATAFSGAEFLWQEYKDVSIWYGITGYAIATGTGIFRMYNDRHWLTDVVAGAGIGILSTKIAYWINPFIQKKIFNSKLIDSASIITPFYNGKQLGLSYVKFF